MKRFVSILLALLMLAALPVTAMAGGDEYYEEGILVSTPEELEEALVEPSDDILISSNFDWGTGDKVLIIDTYSNEKTDYGRDVPTIKLLGSWTIPADWTVICYETLYISSEAYMAAVTVNGTFNFMANGSFSTQSYYGNTLTVNGKLTTSPNNQTNLSDFSALTINGHFENPYRCTLGVATVNSGAVMTLGNTLVTYGLNLPDGFRMKGDLTLYGDITASGSAVIDGSIQIFEDASLNGNLTLDRVQIASSTTTGTTTVTIPSGSRVYIGQLYYVDGRQINVSGQLTLGGNSQSFDNSVLQLDGGTVIMEPGIQFSGADKGASITGTGTLKLYAEYRSDFDTYNSYPRICGTDADEGISDCVGSGITVWCNWADCSHAWNENGTVVAPDCSNRGYTLYTCTNCGTENKTDYVDPTGEHTLSYALSGNSTSQVQITCAGCDAIGKVYLTAPEEVEFTGTPVKCATIRGVGMLGQDIELPEIIYANNDMPGATATAFAEVGGVTISITFKIVDCIHEEGTPATCQKPAVCSKCEMYYGELGDHAWAETISSSYSCHYYECTVCGAKTSEEEMYGMLTAELLEQWEILRYKNNLTDITILDHIYADEASAAARNCLICGSVPAAPPGDMDGDGQVDETDVIQLLWYTLFPEDYEIAGDADFDNNGDTDEDDVIYLLWHTLFPEDYPLE